MMKARMREPRSTHTLELPQRPLRRPLRREGGVAILRRLEPRAAMRVRANA
jgi:hypothetical protein